MMRIATGKNAFANAWTRFFVFSLAVMGFLRSGQAGTLHVVVQDSESQAAGKILVTAGNPYAFDDSEPDPVYTDSSGCAVFSNLAAGVYMVGAFGGDVPYQPADNVHVGGETETRVVLRPVSSPLYTLSGRVLDAREDVPVANAVLRLAWGAIPVYDIEELMERQRTSQNGSFKYPHVYPGEYSIGIETPRGKGMIGFKIDDNGNVVQTEKDSAFHLELTAEKASSP